MEQRIAVRGMVLYKGRLLCVRLKPYKAHLKRDNSYWCLPGGKIEKHESLTNALIREMIEETGVTPVIGNLLYVQQFNYNEQDCLEFFFHVTNSDDYLDIDLTKTSHGAIEIEQIDFIDPSANHVLPTFLTTEDISGHVAANHPTKFFSFL